MSVKRENPFKVLIIVCLLVVVSLLFASCGKEDATDDVSDTADVVDVSEKLAKSDNSQLESVDNLSGGFDIWAYVEDINEVKVDANLDGNAQVEYVVKLRADCNWNTLDDGLRLEIANNVRAACHSKRGIELDALNIACDTAGGRAFDQEQVYKNNSPYAEY